MDDIDSKSTLVQVMAWHQIGTKLLPEPMLPSSLMHICGIRGEIVKWEALIPVREVKMLKAVWRFKTTIGLTIFFQKPFMKIKFKHMLEYWLNID